ncbi:MAG: ADP-ribosylglycohydrolase family protein, partial [Chloroflexota bacterium]
SATAIVKTVSSVADAVLQRTQHPNYFIDRHRARKLYGGKIKQFGRQHPHAGYGTMFKRWLSSESVRGYNSYGNGSAMRVSPIGFAFHTLDDVLREARLSAIVTHNHREGIRGAQAIASAVFLARTNGSKSEIKQFIRERFSYDLEQTLDEIRPNYTFDSSCQGSVPQAVIAFLESDNFEDAIRKAISIGGDSDTIACMTGGIAHAYYGKVPSHIERQIKMILSGQFKSVIDRFRVRYL